MKIRDLKELIDSMDEEELDSNVYLLIQPNWPFVYSVSSAEYISQLDFDYPATGDLDDDYPATGDLDDDYPATDDLDDDEEGFFSEKRPGLYLAEGSQLGYATNVELDHFGWR